MFDEGANHGDPRLHALSKPTCHTPVKRLDSQLTPKDAIREVGPNAVELESLAPLRHGGDHPLLDPPQRRKQSARKQERKRNQIRRGEEMKFSHSLQFNAVPDWSSHYIAYSNLKKLYGIRIILAGGISVEANPPERLTS